MKVTFFQRKPHPQQISIEELFATVRQHLPDDIEPVVHVAPELSKGILSRFRIARAARRSQGDVNHITGDIHFIAMLLDRRRTILTVHDCVPLQTSSGLRRWVLKTFWFSIPIRSVAAVTVISEKTREELKTFVNIDDERIRVIPNCVSPDFTPGTETKPGTDTIRILQVGVKSNKNLLRLAEAMAGLPCSLDIIGNPDPEQILALRNHGIQYRARTGLSREDLVAAYREADIVAFVSTYEGFGMPVIEAQACGTPVVTSDLSPMRDVAGPGACLVDPTAPADIRSALDRLAGDPVYRGQVIEAGLENVKRFQPGAVAEQYARLYRQLAD